MAPEPTPEENALLVHGLGQVGATAGHGSGWGARLAAKLLPADVFETEVTLPLSAAEAEALVRALLGVPAGPLRTMVAAGAMGLNPAVVTATLAAAGPASTTVHLRGVAKEGLIKQRAGREAAQRVADQLAAVI
ncbi:hypothetical protein Acy02nite_59650 [Actinoplanes cyaneus]|uniref:Uncharacterized protein n=1 Tax=Actinoplanes cyaneus TaxID=52696 RepID=A0A919ILH3_9ACTN|nr:hypothetical protein [Actinoplanes cyaneus]MCW2141424.1 hypothetical protein [Actinoplanes cyaneus]GID68084.1 hypothetical protein Acy02nite_59650 [Actinoplanes cyaneus]